MCKTQKRDGIQRTKSCDYKRHAHTAMNILQRAVTINEQETILSDQQESDQQTEVRQKGETSVYFSDRVPRILVEFWENAYNHV